MMTTSGQRPIQHEYKAGKKPQCVQVPRVETAQDLPLCHSQSQGSSSNAPWHRGSVTSGGDAHMYQPSEGNRNKYSLRAHVSSWFDGVGASVRVSANVSVQQDLDTVCGAVHDTQSLTVKTGALPRNYRNLGGCARSWGSAPAAAVTTAPQPLVAVLGTLPFGAPP